MALGRHPGPAGRTQQGTPSRQTATATRRAALFASGLQRSDDPTATMAAEAITATVRRFGIHGCISRMAQEFGDDPEVAAERMRWICQLVAEIPARPHVVAAGDGSRPGRRRAA